MPDVKKSHKGPQPLASQAAAIKAAKADYANALAELQAACEHNTVLRHEDSNYVAYRVCEDCGLSCRADWDSPVHVKAGDSILMGKRSYSVSWAEYHRALPVVNPPASTTDGERP